MIHRIHRMCDAITEAVLLAAVVSVPVFFDIHALHPFENDKVNLLRVFVLVGTAAWGIGKLCEFQLHREKTLQGLSQEPSFWKRPLVIPVLALAGTTTLSLAFSLAPHISWWGSHTYNQGACSVLSYILLFFLFLDLLRSPGRWARLQYAIILASIPVSAYAIIQRFGLESLAFLVETDVRQRPTGSLGNPIFMAGYLIMAFPVTLERLIVACFPRLRGGKESRPNRLTILPCGIALLLQLAAIFFSRSRGPWLGFSASILIMIILSLAVQSRLVSRTGSLIQRRIVLGLGSCVIALSIAGAGVVGYFGFRDGLRGSGRVRTVIWEGITEMMRPNIPLEYSGGRVDRFNSLRPLIGYGPDTMMLAFGRFHSPELSALHSRQATTDRAHNDILDTWATLGPLGVLAQLSLIACVFFHGFCRLGLVRGRSDRNRFTFLCVAFSLLGLVIPWLAGAGHFVGIGVGAGLAAGIFVYVAWALFQVQPAQERPLDRKDLLVLLILGAVMGHFIELQFGIAVAATRSLFFVLAAALAALAAGELHPALVNAPLPNVSHSPATQPSGKHRSKKKHASESMPPAILPVWRRLLPYALLVTITLMVLDFNFIQKRASPGIGSTGLFTKSWTTILDEKLQPVDGFGPIWIVVVSAVLALLLALGEIVGPKRPERGKVAAISAFLAVSFAAWFIYGLNHAGRLLFLPSSTPIRAVADQVAGNITNFLFWQFAFLILLALAIIKSELPATNQPSPQPGVVLVLGSLLVVIGALYASRATIDQMRANIYAKMGEIAGKQGAWRDSVVFYELAEQAAPNQDYYSLFLSRALYQGARKVTDEPSRRRLIDRSEHAALRAVGLSPWNVDHMLNLAGIYATESLDEKDKEKQRALGKKASETYEKAAALSPKAAHIYTLWGRVLSQIGEYEQAAKLYQKSLGIDPGYGETYTRFEEMVASMSNAAEALQYARQFRSLAPAQQQPSIDAQIQKLEQRSKEQ